MENQDQVKYWFYAKRYGFGWGLPASWEGWVVFIGYLATMIGCPFILPIIYFPMVVISATALLIWICFKKGEKLQWRFGSKDQFSPKQVKVFSVFAHILMSPLILALGIWLYCNPPQDIGHFGYRTPTSMQNDIMWDEAQIYSARVLIIAACISLTYQTISFFTMKPEISLITSSMVMVFCIVIVLPLTELHLKNFETVDNTKVNLTTEP